MGFKRIFYDRILIFICLYFHMISIYEVLGLKKIVHDKWILLQIIFTPLWTKCLCLHCMYSSRDRTVRSIGNWFYSFSCLRCSQSNNDFLIVFFPCAYKYFFLHIHISILHNNTYQRKSLWFDLTTFRG